MVEFPLHPGLTRALLKAASLGCQDLLLPVAAMLSVENIFIRPGQPDKQKEAAKKHRALAAKTGNMNDFATLLSVFNSCKSSDRPSSWCKENWIHWRALKGEIFLLKLLTGIKVNSSDSACAQDTSPMLPEEAAEDVTKKLEKRNNEAAVQRTLCLLDVTSHCVRLLGCCSDTQTEGFHARRATNRIKPVERGGSIFFSEVLNSIQPSSAYSVPTYVDFILLFMLACVKECRSF
ncbi:hypothetical protein GOODEAATRI_007219 [Goodea atripinnis]|uniref:Helicase-associated domain-containing protein n=1 Tax=Goodea atripinnis TaxID=208336 RepID=A0ABV0MQ01_9TELE